MASTVFLSENGPYRQLVQSEDGSRHCSYRFTRSTVTGMFSDASKFV
jgi:hypothetical protein